MSVEQQITADLAIVARASRERPVSLDDTLRAVGALPPAPRASVGDVDLVLVAMARVFAVRVARITASALMLAAVVAILGYVAMPLDTWDDWGALDRLVYEDPTGLVMRLLFAAGLAYVAAVQLAARWFERALGGACIGAATIPRARGHQMVDRLDGWAIALPIAAATAFFVVFRQSRLVVGDAGLDGMLVVLDDPHWTPTDRIWSLVPLVATVIAGLGAGVALARSQRRGRAIPGWLVLVAGTAVFASLVLGPPYVILPRAVRAVCLVAGGLATFTLISSFVLARRRREQAAIRGEDLP